MSSVLFAWRKAADPEMEGLLVRMSKVSVDKVVLIHACPGSSAPGSWPMAQGPRPARVPRE